MPRECDWLRPCDCNECIDELKEICEICCKGKGYRVGSRYKTDRKGCGYYDFKTCCYTCYQFFYGINNSRNFRKMRNEVLGLPKIEKDDRLPDILKKYFECEAEVINDYRDIFSGVLTFKCVAFYEVPEIDEHWIEINLEIEPNEDLLQWFNNKILPTILKKLETYSNSITILGIHLEFQPKGSDEENDDGQPPNKKKCK